MSRDEILNMPAGREMDKWIAIHIMKLDDIPLYGAPCPYCGSEMWHGKERSRCSSCNEWRYSPYKQYSDDIAAAWEVVEKLKLHIGPTSNEKQESWYASNRHNFNDPDLIIVIADTAPLAICRAALLAVMESP